MQTRGPNGFSMIELAIVLAMLAILAAAALPSYQEYVRKSRRSDAVSRLTLLQQAQERWRANHLSYAGALADLGIPETVDGGHYQLALPSAASDGYRATATPVEGSPQTADQRCAVIVLALDKGEILYGSQNGDGDEDAGPHNACWNR
jgi:type IV pilus assembly protein PilE